MGDQDVTAVVSLLSRRSGFLRELREGEATKQELADAQSVSRSTVDRAVRDLEDRGLVRRDRSEVCITLAGRLVFGAYEDIVTTLDGVCSATSILEGLPSDAQIDLSVFEDATVIQGTRHDPHRPATAIEEFTRNATQIRGFVSAVLPSHVDVYHERLTADKVEVELVVTDAVLDTLITGHRDALEATLASGNLTLYRTPDPPEYTLLVGDRGGSREVHVAAHDEHGIMGVIQNDTPGAVSWARNAFRAVRYGAEEITFD